MSFIAMKSIYIYELRNDLTFFVRFTYLVVRKAYTIMNILSNEHYKYVKIT